MNQTRHTSATVSDTALGTHATPAAAATANHVQDPLAVLERELLAHPRTHRYLHHHRHQTQTQAHAQAQAQAQSQTGAGSDASHLAPPISSAASRSRTPSPAPSTGARRCMAATDAWMPLDEEEEDSRQDSQRFPGMPDRARSWDGQAYRHVMMVQATGLVCACHPSEHGLDGHAKHHCINVPPQNSYDADRGFSEVSH